MLISRLSRSRVSPCCSLNRMLLNVAAFNRIREFALCVLTLQSPSQPHIYHLKSGAN
nr:MAG TPA: hypothetical protein [Caudoviricetes sp.]